MYLKIIHNPFLFMYAFRKTFSRKCCWGFSICAAQLKPIEQDLFSVLKKDSPCTVRRLLDNVVKYEDKFTFDNVNGIFRQTQKWSQNAQNLLCFKVPMKRNFLFFHVKERKK